MLLPCSCESCGRPLWHGLFSRRTPSRYLTSDKLGGEDGCRSRKSERSSCNSWSEGRLHIPPLVPFHFSSRLLWHRLPACVPGFPWPRAPCPGLALAEPLRRHPACIPGFPDQGPSPRLHFGRGVAQASCLCPRFSCPTNPSPRPGLGRTVAQASCLHPRFPSQGIPAQARPLRAPPPASSHQSPGNTPRGSQHQASITTRSPSTLTTIPRFPYPFPASAHAFAGRRLS